MRVVSRTGCEVAETRPLRDNKHVGLQELHKSVGLTMMASSPKVVDMLALVALRLALVALRRRHWPRCSAQVEHWLALILGHSTTSTRLRKVDSNPQTGAGTDYESCTTFEAASKRYFALQMLEQSAQTASAEVTLERGCCLLCPAPAFSAEVALERVCCAS